MIRQKTAMPTTLFLVLTTLLLSACSAIGLPSPDTLSRKAAPATGSGTTPDEYQNLPTPPLLSEPYMSQDENLLTAASTLVLGKAEAVLIDAQFSASEARQLVERIRRSGRRLSTIYISHGDPEYYFGLQTIKAAFPDAAVVATPQTIARIRASGETLLKIWQHELGDDAPTRLIMPEPLDGDRIMLERQSLRIVDARAGGQPESDQNQHFVWIPSIRTVVAGNLVYSGEHVNLAEAKTPQERADWLNALRKIAVLNPDVVIPGHYSRNGSLNLDAVRFTADYIRAFEAVNQEAPNATALVEAMRARYPDLRGNGTLELSARVVRGELTAP